MRYGIFCDIHANLEAMNTVLSFFKSKDIDCYLCIGDIVGYGPNPNECVEIIKQLNPLHIIAGNHDWAACGLKDIMWFNEYAQKAIIWTWHTLKQENQIYLSELPKISSDSDITIVHGSPRDPLDEYILSQSQYEDLLPYLATGITFVGHSHIPFILNNNSLKIIKNSSAFQLNPKEKYIINSGSVGQPRDGNNNASCGIYDSKTREFKLFRIKYDYNLTQEKMRQHRLPPFLIERLAIGK